MHFFALKTMLFLLLPPSSLLLLVLAGFFLFVSGHKRSGRTMMTLGFFLLYLLSTSIVSHPLIGLLESEYRPLGDKIQKADAVVVLTAGAKDLSYFGLAPRPSSSSLERLVQGVEICRRVQGVPLLISGGSGDPARPHLSEARALGAAAVDLGIPEGRIVIEDASRNTYESALKVRSILVGENPRVILVTSAYHMGRAAGFFRKRGFDVIPAPADFRKEDTPLSFLSFVPAAASLETSSTAIYEYLSRIWYRFHK